MVFAWTSAVAVIGILSIQILVSVAIIAWFGREPHGLGIWTRVIAPLIALAGLSIGLGLVIRNLPLLAGTDSAIVWAFPWLVAATAAIGALYALFLRNRRPALYAALGQAITEV